MHLDTNLVNPFPSLLYPHIRRVPTVAAADLPASSPSWSHFTHADAMDDSLEETRIVLGVAMSTPDRRSEMASSPLSSIASRSPTPPSGLFEFRNYPSPPSSSQISSQTGSPCPDDGGADQSAREDDDGAPPKKKPRLSQDRKPRTTEHLDMLDGTATPESQISQLEKLRKVLLKKRKIVVVAGAGISVSAGIPDFRSSKGLFKSLKKQHNLKSSGKDLFDASVYKDDMSTSSFHEMVRSLSTMTKSAHPTPFHHLLATLAHEDRLLRLYSQNVDGIDTSLEPLATQIPLNRKAPWPKTIQLHGSLEKMVCSKCPLVLDLEPDLFNGPTPPMCEVCVETDAVRTEHAGKRSHGIGRLRPRMVLYNEHNPDDEAIGAVVKSDLRTRPDALIVVGTTLKVPGVKRIVKEMCGVVRDRRDGLTIWVNNDSPPVSKDYEWDLIVRGPCDNVANLAHLRRWDEPFVEPTSDEQAEKAKTTTEEDEIVVKVPVPSRTAELATIPTPSPSPALDPQNLVEKTKKKKKQQKQKQTKLGPGAPKPKVPTKRAKKPGATTATKKKQLAMASAVSKITSQFQVSKISPTAQNGDTKSSNTINSTKLQPMRPLSPSAVQYNSLPGHLQIQFPGLQSDSTASVKVAHVDTDLTMVKVENTPSSPARDSSPNRRVSIESLLN